MRLAPRPATSPSTWARRRLPGTDRKVDRSATAPGRPSRSTPATRTPSSSSTTSPTRASCATAPLVEPPFPDGVNVEFVVRRGERHVRCGCTSAGSARPGPAAPVPARSMVAQRPARRRRPGARRTSSTCPAAGYVTERADGHVELTGPAVLVATGEVGPVTDPRARRPRPARGPPPGVAPRPRRGLARHSRSRPRHLLEKAAAALDAGRRATRRTELVRRTQALGHDEHEDVEVCSWSVHMSALHARQRRPRGQDDEWAWLEAARTVLPTARRRPAAMELIDVLATIRQDYRLEPRRVDPAGTLGPRRGAATGHHRGPRARRRGGSRRAGHDRRLRGRRRRDRGRTGVTVRPTASATAAAAKPVVTGLGGAFMISAEAKAAGKDGGYRGWQLYVAGRAGVLGDGRRRGGRRGARLPPPRPGAAGLGGRPGRRAAGRDRRPVRRGVPRLGPAPLRRAGRGRPAGRAARAGRAAPPTRPGWPLFAAWRAQPLPDDGPGRVVQLLHVLREHRGGAHLGAVRSRRAERRWRRSSPAPGDRATPTFFGWPEPLPEVTDELRARLAQAEEATDAQVGPAYAVLDDGAARRPAAAARRPPLPPPGRKPERRRALISGDGPPEFRATLEHDDFCLTTTSTTRRTCSTPSTRLPSTRPTRATTTASSSTSPTARRCAGSPACRPSSRTSPRSSTGSCGSSGSC